MLTTGTVTRLDAETLEATVEVSGVSITAEYDETDNEWEPSSAQQFPDVLAALDAALVEYRARAAAERRAD